MGSRAVSRGLIELGERIRKRRQERHLTQEAFAELVGVSVNTVSRIEGGQTAMSIETFKKMAQVLGVNAGELLGENILWAVGEKEIDSMVFRIHHLKKSDQEIVIHTMDALLEGFDRHR